MGSSSNIFKAYDGHESKKCQSPVPLKVVTMRILRQVRPPFGRLEFRGCLEID